MLEWGPARIPQPPDSFTQRITIEDEGLRPESLEIAATFRVRRYRRVPLVTSLPPQRRTHSSIPLDLNQMPYVPLIIPNALVVISSTFEDINQESVVVMVIYLIVIESRLGSLIVDRK